MRTPRRSLSALLALVLVLPCLAAETPEPQEDPRAQSSPALDGRSFPGRIRATGILGLFRVRGTLSFRDGLLVWSARGTEESAPYEIEEDDGLAKFTSRVALENGTYVDWSGSFDGESLRDVKAVWNRTKEEDWVHDLFLPDVVTLVFRARNP